MEVEPGHLKPVMLLSGPEAIRVLGKLQVCSRRSHAIGRKDRLLSCKAIARCWHVQTYRLWDMPTVASQFGGRAA